MHDAIAELDAGHVRMCFGAAMLVFSALVELVVADWRSERACRDGEVRVLLQRAHEVIGKLDFRSVERAVLAVGERRDF
jgi:hypothetical protein